VLQIPELVVLELWFYFDLEKVVIL